MTDDLSLRASAPGKILLAGEYAILEGAEALVMAVNRRAVAGVGDPRRLSPFVDAVVDAVASERGPFGPEAQLARRTAIDTTALNDASGAKLGLGSSAAVTVAAVALALSGDEVLDRELVHQIAHRAHREAQGGRGSGADVAASVWGGVLALRRPSEPARALEVRPVALPPGLTLVPVWTGRPADTVALVGTMRELHDRDRAEYLALVAAMVPPATALIEACENGDSTAAVAALAAAGEALAALGRVAGIDLETETVRTLARRAAPWGGTAKATGAGGGDVALAAFPDAGAAAGFRDEIAGMGITALELSVDPIGVSLERA